MDFSNLTTRRRYIIKPELQLKYLLITLSLIILTGIAVVLFVNLTISSSTKLENLTKIDILAVKTLVYKSVFSVLAIVIVIVFLAGILFLHRLTGPLFVIEKLLRMVADGDLTLKLKLRKGDELQSLAEEFQNMVDSLRKNFIEDKERIENVKQELDKIILELEKRPIEEIKSKMTFVKNQLTQLYSKYKL